MAAMVTDNPESVMPIKKNRMGLPFLTLEQIIAVKAAIHMSQRRTELQGEDTNSKSREKRSNASLPPISFITSSRFGKTSNLKFNTAMEPTSTVFAPTPNAALKMHPSLPFDESSFALSRYR